MPIVTKLQKFYWKHAAAKAYQPSKETSLSKIDLFYSDGESCGHHASQLMKELEATATLVGPRIYTQGIPPDRQQDKMCSIYVPTFDWYCGIFFMIIVHIINNIMMYSNSNCSY